MQWEKQSFLKLIDIKQRKVVKIISQVMHEQKG